MATDTPFPIGAWVVDPGMRRLGRGIGVGNATGRVTFEPYAGEIIGTGLLCKVPVYSVKFAEALGFVFIKDALCYMCGADSDASHADGCVEPKLREIPHEPGYGS